ncbi:MAG: hypothetical protein ACE5I0_08075 [Candidatus Binatia bacterium]
METLAVFSIWHDFGTSSPLDMTAKKPRKRTLAGYLLSALLLALAGRYSVMKETRLAHADSGRAATKGVMTLATVSQKATDCKKEENLVFRTLCFGDRAKAHNDVSICDQARYAGVRFQYYYILAKHTEDTSVCRKIPDRELEDGCYSDIALLKKSAERIFIPRESKTAVITKSESQCGMDVYMMRSRIQGYKVAVLAYRSTSSSRLKSY